MIKCFNMEFKYCLNPESETPIMLLNQHLGVDEEGNIGVLGNDFARELYALDSMGKKSCEIRINSTGGSVVEGYDIYSAMLQTKMKCDTVCVGICASMSAVIFEAGRNRIMMDYGLLMFHNPFNSNGSDMGLNKIKESLITMVSNKCKKDTGEVSNIFQATTWYNSDEALFNNMCDIVESSSDYNKARNVKAVFDSLENKDLNNLQKEFATIVNSVKITDKSVQVENKVETKINKMENVNKLLGLQNSATEIETVDAIRNVFSELKAIKDALVEKDNLLKEYQEKEAKLNAQVARNKATELVKPFVDKGSIKAESMEKWINRAIVNFEDTKDALEEIPFSKTAPVMEVQNKTTLKDPFKILNK